MLALALAIALAPAYPYDDTIALKVTQANVLTWTQEKTPTVIDRWRLKCRHGIESIQREITSKDYSISIADLSLEPGVYTNCGFTAINAQGESKPYPVPNFEYTHSYWGLTKSLLELTAMLASAGTLAFAIRRKVRQAATFVYTRLVHKPAPLSLPAPLVVLETPEVIHAKRH